MINNFQLVGPYNSGANYLLIEIKTIIVSPYDVEENPLVSAFGMVDFKPGSIALFGPGRYVES